jgi:hypothetical protein
MSLNNTFIKLFDDPQAKASIASYHAHYQLKTFNLATTSLRHIQKWYDRITDIHNGVVGSHGNYYSDPRAIGLVTKTDPPFLTLAGQEFLKSRTQYYQSDTRAEYILNKILYYSPNAPAATNPMLKTRHDNLMEFLCKCRPTQNMLIVLNDSSLLTIAEILSSFGSALEAFLLLPTTDLVAFAKLGNEGFNNLFKGMTVPQGYVDLASKIGGEYTRAKERRRNYLLSHLFLTLRNQLLSSQLQYMPLTIPYPFTNLIAESTAFDEVANFTDDIRIEIDTDGYIIFLNETMLTTPALTLVAIHNIQIGAIPKTRHKPPAQSTGQIKKKQNMEPYFVDAPLSIEAEDYVQQHLDINQNNVIRRIGHTTAESLPISDGLLPGADILIEDNLGKLLKCIEVKSSRDDFPPNIRLTAAEYIRAINCKTQGIPYELHVVTFLKNQPQPIVSLSSNFQDQVANLAITDLSGMEIHITQT